MTRPRDDPADLYLTYRVGPSGAARLPGGSGRSGARREHTKTPPHNSIPCTLAIKNSGSLFHPLAPPAKLCFFAFGLMGRIVYVRTPTGTLRRICTHLRSHTPAGTGRRICASGVGVVCCVRCGVVCCVGVWCFHVDLWFRCGVVRVVVVFPFGLVVPVWCVASKFGRVL